MKRAFRRFTQWLIRLLLRVGLLPASTKADTDTMGEYKRLMAEKDDPKPGLVLPDPNAPHAALIRRVRLYAQNGAKALAPLLDKPLPDPLPGFDLEQRMHDCVTAAEYADDRDAHAILEGVVLVGGWSNAQAIAAIHAAYNSPWTVVDGEVYE